MPARRLFILAYCLAGDAPSGEPPSAGFTSAAAGASGAHLCLPRTAVRRARRSPALHPRHEFKPPRATPASAQRGAVNRGAQAGVKALLCLLVWESRDRRLAGAGICPRRSPRRGRLPSA